MEDRRLDPLEQVHGLSESALVARAMATDYPAVSRAAIGQLVRAHSRRLTSVLTTIVCDDGQNADVRAMAALNLGRAAKPAHRKALLEVVSGSPNPVRRRAVEALARIGNKESLEHLRQLRSRDPVVKRSIDFARSVISYRLGLGTDLLEAPPARHLASTQQMRSMDMAISPATGKLLEEALDASRVELPAMRMSSAGAHQLACGANQFVLAFNGNIHKRKTLSSLGRRNSVLMVVLWKPSTLDVFETYMYVLSHPEGKGRLRLLGLRSMGLVTLSGEIELGRNSAAFHIHSTETPHQVPLELEGSYDHKAQSIEFTTAVIESNFPRNTKGSRIPQRNHPAGG